MRVTESMGPAWETMKRILFRPFNAGTWFSFGFLFFLQSCVEGGGSNTFRVPNFNSSGSHGGSHGDSGNDVAGIAHDFLNDLSRLPGSPGGLPETGFMVMIAVIAIVVSIPLVILMYWLGTRGQMMSIRSVAMGQANIGEQWNATRQPAGLLLKFELVIVAISLVVFLPLAFGGVILALPTVRDGVPIEDVLPALIGLGVVALLAIIPLTLVGAMARNFVAPIMLKHGIGAREGWKRFWAVGKGHIGGIFVFYLMRILVSIGAGIVGIVAGFFTCCLGFLPVLHQTLMAPWYVFERAWTLEVLASMSPDFDLRGGVAPPPMPYGYGGGGYEPPNPYAGQPTDNPYAPPGYGGGGGGGSGGPPPGGFGGPPPGGFGAP